MVMAPPSVSADLPALTPEFETSIPNLFVVGELGGLALIKNAVNQGRDCVDVIARRLPALRRGSRSGRADGGAPVVDVCIVGAGPGGLSASLRAIESGLSYVTLEQDELGGTVAKYPRQKLVLTSPVEFPLHGKFRKLEISKEDLLRFWNDAAREAGLKVNGRERVDQVQREPGGGFTIETTKGKYRALTVILAIGRRGTPRKLEIPGEQLAKVMYSLLDAEAYSGHQILVVGGGDSAVEAAMGLAHQKGNRVTLSYRGEAFTRLKERNASRIQEYLKQGRLSVLFSSRPVEVRPREVLLELKGGPRALPNDYMWVFAGGTPPNAFLERIGVNLGQRDLTAEGSREALRVA
jgi:thioredoxin reductase